MNGNWIYGYDTLNRLTSARSSTTGLAWSYDAFGNRRVQVATAGYAPQPVASFSSANNRMDGYRYDAAGNVLDDGPCQTNHKYAYDAEGRLSKSNFGQTVYTYDAQGLRVAKWSSGTLSQVYLYDVAGRRVIDMNGSGAIQRAEIYAGARHLATLQGGSYYYIHTNWLGTETARTDGSGTLCETTSALPFGDAAQSSGTCAPSPNFFTGKERDQESGNDYFEARYYSSAMGRFLSPDWSAKEDPVPYAQLDDPQSLNLYSYVRNNPLSRTDPDGHCDDKGQNCSLWDHVAGTVGGILNVVPGTVNLGIDAFYAVSSRLGGPQLDEMDYIQPDAHASMGGVQTGEVLQLALPTGDMAKGGQLLENAAAGAAYEAKVAKELIAEGKTILGSHVGVQTEEGLRVVDHLVQDGKQLTNVEVKTGNAVRNAAQLRKDASMASKGGKIVGKNAPANLRGQRVKLPTVVRKPQP